MVELLKQGQYQPFEVIDQCISIFAGANGFLDDLNKTDVSAFEASLLEYMHGPGKALREKLVSNRSFKGLEDEFKGILTDFKSSWSPSE